MFDHIIHVLRVEALLRTKSVRRNATVRALPSPAMTKPWADDLTASSQGIAELVHLQADYCALFRSHCHDQFRIRHLESSASLNIAREAVFGIAS
jgi:hypothetical protein